MTPEQVKRLQGMLAECYRLSGADPDDNEDWRLAEYAVQEVRTLRERADTDSAEVLRLRAEVERLRAGIAGEAATLSAVAEIEDYPRVSRAWRMAAARLQALLEVKP